MVASRCKLAGAGKDRAGAAYVVPNPYARAPNFTLPYVHKLIVFGNSYSTSVSGTRPWARQHGHEESAANAELRLHPSEAAAGAGH
jgi:hypothetical protein